MDSEHHQAKRHEHTRGGQESSQPGLSMEEGRPWSVKVFQCYSYFGVRYCQKRLEGELISYADAPSTSCRKDRRPVFEWILNIAGRGFYPIFLCDKERSFLVHVTWSRFLVPFTLRSVCSPRYLIHITQEPGTNSDCVQEQRGW